MEDENELDQNLKDQNGNQNHDDDQEDQDQNDQGQNDDDQNNDDGDEGEDTIESLKAKLAKTQQAYENQKKRAEKAEGKQSDDGKNKKVEPPKKNTKSDNLSPKDLYALMEKKVPKEDIDEVVQYANFTKTSVEEALETDFMTKFLADKAEKRATARATNIGNSRRGTGKVSGTSLLNNASQKGEIPDSDEDLDRMIDARLEQKRQNSSNKR